MKKRKLKGWVVELLFIIVVFTTAILFMFALSERVEQVDHNEVIYEKYN